MHRSIIIRTFANFFVFFIYKKFVVGRSIPPDIGMLSSYLVIDSVKLQNFFGSHKLFNKKDLFIFFFIDANYSMLWEQN